MALVQVTIHVLNDDEDGTPIASVEYTIKDEDQTQVLAFGTSDDGVIGPLSLPESTVYAVLLYKPFAVFDVPYTIDVTASSIQSFDLTGHYSTIEPPLNSSVCRLYGSLLDMKGDPLVGVTVSVENLFRSSGLISNLSFVGGPRALVVTGESGEFTIDLVRGIIVRLVIQETHLAVQFQVPDQELLNVIDVISMGEQEIPPVVLGS